MGKKCSLTNVFFLCIIMASVSCTAFSAEKEILSIWPTSPLKINGSDEEWGKETICFEKKFKVNYAFQNDENDLFILFKFDDLSYLSSIDQTGMTIWLNAEGKGKKDFGITFFKKKVPIETFLSLLEQQREAIPAEEKEQLRQQPYYFIYFTQVIGKKAGFSGLVENKESPRAFFMSASTQEKVVYEFVVPLKSEGGFTAVTGIKPGQKIKIGFEWGGLTEQMKIKRIKKLRERSEQSGDPNPDIEEELKALKKERVLDPDFNKPSDEPKKYVFWVDVRLAMKE